MCGIAGYLSKQKETDLTGYLQQAVMALSKRGPDAQQVVRLSANVGFAHARLSIIDTSSIANQPMTDASGRYTIIFNGEIFNFRELHQQFLSNTVFKSHSDTEVLLYLYILLGKKCLEQLNGFFAFAVFDNQTGEIFLARDRFGIKPLHLYTDDRMVIFASELKAILQFPIKREIDFDTLAMYLQLNYVPGNASMFRNIRKLDPGCYAVIDALGAVTTERYYSIPYHVGERIDASRLNYQQATATLKKLVEESVQRRLVSDVPLGTFLSGGIDSSIVTACAAQHVTGLNTFSIGYKDEPYFDETYYANLVAKKWKTNHTVFSITGDEMFGNIFDALDYMDEPFADSSAIAVHILSQKTRQKVTVSLSGDGGDELFAGYNKHQAELRARQNSALNLLVKAGSPLFAILPKSRDSKTFNRFRQLHRYAEGVKLSANERYWRWCVFQSQGEAVSLLKNKSQVDLHEVAARKSRITNLIGPTGDLNDVLHADMQMVLPNDMLTKVDLMSMANGQEIRVPLLDYTVVDFAFSLPVAYKIEAGNGKKILKDAFRNELPPELFNRSKMGFEVPLLKWLQTGLRSLIENDLLEKNFVSDQGIFDVAEIEKLKMRIFSADPGDAHAVLWALVVFQYWYKKYMAPTN